MEKINIAELLKDCPKGMELDCILFSAKVIYKGLSKRIPTRPIVVQTEHGFEFELTQYGQIHNIVGSNCVIFPKGKTSWEGFHRPFKDGDIIACDTEKGAQLFIFKENIYNYDYVQCYMMLDCGGEIGFEIGDYYVERFATEEEKQKLFKAIKDNGYKWNPETKTLDKLIQPKFKVGDRVKQIGSPRSYIIRSVEFDRYILHNNQFIRFKDEHIYELVNKFDISTFIPFESRVLVRDHDKDVWRASFWGCLINNRYGYNYDTTRGYSKQCIPYEGNEHLLGKTDDCKNFYKTWE